MDNRTRVIATMIIWVIFGFMLLIIAASLLAANADLDRFGSMVVLAIISVLAIAVTRSTHSVWAGSQNSMESQTTHFAKSKRNGRHRIEDLINTMNDDEVYDLEALLLARSEEEARRQRRG